MGNMNSKSIPRDLTYSTFKKKKKKGGWGSPYCSFHANCHAKILIQDLFHIIKLKKTFDQNKTEKKNEQNTQNLLYK